MKVVNINNDKYFINLVKEGVIKVHKDGKVKNLVTNKYIGYKNKAGYINIGHKIRGKNIVMHMLVHRLVYIVFKNNLKPLPFIVNHRDGIKSNNKISNLEASSHSENNKHAYDIGLKVISQKTLDRLKSLQGEKAVCAKLTNKQAWDVRFVRLKYSYSHYKLAKIFGIDRSGITNLINFKTYKAIKLFYYHPYAVLRRSKV